MSYKLGKRSLKNLVGVHPILSFCVMEAIKVSEVDFGVICGVRSMDRQKQLVAEGKSKTMNSYHLYGLAVDLVPYVDGKFTWEDEEAFAKVEKAMKEVASRHYLPIDWGADLWGGWDKAHWQLTGLRDEYDIRRFGTGRKR